MNRIIVHNLCEIATFTYYSPVFLSAMRVSCVSDASSADNFGCSGSSHSRPAH